MEGTEKSPGRRPSWMTLYGFEGEGDAWSDRLWTEWPLPNFVYDETRHKSEISKSD